jgi:signal transduction histidine kinase
MLKLKFSVDAALLKELGERLIGKHYIALAELVKNSYDADATKVTIILDPENDRIEVRDNGHGMDLNDFQNFWMRVGSTHKQKQKVSKIGGRPLTGSKGVGRLSVQYLARKLELRTVSNEKPRQILNAQVEWEKAVKAKELVEAEVEYEITYIPKEGEPEPMGTTIVLSGLKHTWDTAAIRGLAREIWWLQPPFRNPADLISDPEKAFEIKFESPAKKLKDEFDWHLKAVMDSWHAKLIGRNSDGKVNISLEFAGQDTIYDEYEIPECKLKDGSFEIRIFHFRLRKPPAGIDIDEINKYLNEYGGVHVYDSGFHLPYYGMKKNDWLGIEHDHAMRSRHTELLPERLKFKGGLLSFLPNLQRVFGVVNVDTSKEDKEDGLNILITRDRLQENQGFDNLVFMVRWAMDFYAVEELKRSYKQKLSSGEIGHPEYKSIEDILKEHRKEIPDAVYSIIKDWSQNVKIAMKTETEDINKQTSLLGPLATAGISSLAYQHEMKQQFRMIDEIISNIDDLEGNDQASRQALQRLKTDLSSWVERSRSTNALFTYLSDSENLGMKKRFNAKKVIDDIKEHVEFLGRGIPIDTDNINNDFLLPKATLAEWSSIFQNIFINAFNAMIDSKKKNIDVSTRVKAGFHEILIQDTGCGVDLATAEELFKPFVRKSKISKERQALGYGGTGLGLTIVDMVAKSLHCHVSFVKPELGYKTAFSIRWREE